MTPESAVQDTGSQNAALSRPAHNARAELLARSAHTGQSAPVDAIVELAEAYWEHYRRSTSGDRSVQRTAEETRWAWEEIEERVHSMPRDAIQLLTVVADTAPDDAALAYLGAGPIEDLIRQCASDVVVIDRVEGAAARNDNFRKGLAMRLVR